MGEGGCAKAVGEGGVDGLGGVCGKEVVLLGKKCSRRSRINCSNAVFVQN